MDSSNKRKNSPGEANGRQFKKSKGGVAGRWQTTHHKAKLEVLKAKGRTLEVGNVGFWITCQRGKEAVALDEALSICEEAGEKLYGIKPAGLGEEGSDNEDDIEASIQKEMSSLKDSSRSRREESVFDPVRLSLDCLIFMRTKAPVEPCEFVRKICEDARLVSDKKQRRSRFINRFTPITAMGKATASGVEEVARKVLADHFQLAGQEEQTPLGQEKGGDHSYAIRLTFRAHNQLKRDDVIKQVAALVGPRHKVDLGNPDRYVLVDIFQTFVGMSVVGRDWEPLKKYNLRELYESASKSQNSSDKQEKESKGNKSEGEKPKDEPKNSKPEEKAQQDEAKEVTSKDAE